MLHKIVLAGGSGYLGQVLADFYKTHAGEIVILSRKPRRSSANIRYAVWDGSTAGSWTKELGGCELLINLSGRNVNCRYTKKNRAEILQSRIGTTSLLGKVIAGLADPPRVWINLASSTIYRHAEDRFQDEEKGETGAGFSVDVCKAWEKTFWDAATPLTKKIILRTAIVFGKMDGVIPRLVNLVKMGMG
jgi:NAD dependent epimerase/dehydratase family enzyme